MKNTIYKYLFFLIIIFYSIILSQYGFENFDTGFISSFSWRIVNGQHIYEDFLYKFPPTTPYLHAFFMNLFPKESQFILFRITSYLFFSAQVYFIVSGFWNFYELKKYNKWGVLSTCFIISMLNFPPCPWTTTDGLFFASLAFWIVSINKNLSTFKVLLISALCLLSALSKQSFYLIPIFFLIWIYIQYGFRNSAQFLAFILLELVIFFKLITSVTSWENFVKQTTGETSLYQLFYSGIHNYIYIKLKYFVLIFGLILITCCILFFIKKLKIVIQLLKWISILLFCIAIVFSFFKEVEIGSRIAFMACIPGLLFSYLAYKKRLVYYMPTCVSLGIAWSSSISLGYPFPILFASGIIMSFIALMKDEVKLSSKYYMLITIPICIISFSYNLRPYREKQILNLTYSLEKISPKLKHIKTNKESFEKYAELKELIRKYGENFIVAPSFPMANYIFDNQSELPADWIINTEINRQSNLFIKKMSEKKNYIFLEKSFLNHEEFVTDKIENFSYVAYFVYNKFNTIEETNYFIVYNGLKKNEKLP